MHVNSVMVKCSMSCLFVITSKEIQSSGGNAGHDPCEDALAALDLVLHRLHSSGLLSLSVSVCVLDITTESQHHN